MNTLSKNKKQLLQFIVRKTYMCIPLEFVKKTLPLPKVEIIPNAPFYLVGLMNLAGKSVPIIDLATRLGLSRHGEKYTIFNPVMLCQSKTTEIGLVVDEVLGLCEIDEDALQMHEEFNDINSPFLASVLVKNKISLLLNVERILAIDPAKQHPDFIINEKLINLVHKHE